MTHTLVLTQRSAMADRRSRHFRQRGEAHLRRPALTGSSKPRTDPANIACLDAVPGAVNVPHPQPDDSCQTKVHAWDWSGPVRTGRPYLAAHSTRAKARYRFREVDSMFPSIIGAASDYQAAAGGTFATVRDNGPCELGIVIGGSSCSLKAGGFLCPSANGLGGLSGMGRRAVLGGSWC